MRFGPADGPVAVVAPPLLEEANRTRAVTVAMLRALAERGVAGVLPDLPGQGDSVAALASVTLPDMRQAFAAAVAAVEAEGRRAYGVGMRSGALLDGYARLHGRWHLAPQGGAALVRELGRVRRARGDAAQPPGERWWTCGGGAPVEIAGNLLSPDLLTELSLAEPFAGPGVPRRTVRLLSDPAPADFRLPGTPPWRRGEPAANPGLSQALAADIADWIAACERR